MWINNILLKLINNWQHFVKGKVFRLFHYSLSFNRNIGYSRILLICTTIKSKRKSHSFATGGSTTATGELQALNMWVACGGQNFQFKRFDNELARDFCVVHYFSPFLLFALCILRAQSRINCPIRCHRWKFLITSALHPVIRPNCNGVVAVTSTHPQTRKTRGQGF